MTTIYNTTITEPVYLPADCWCEVLSFVTDAKDRFKVLTTDKDIYISLSLKNSFTEQTVNLRRSGVTDAGLAHLAKVEVIDLWSCQRVTDAGLAHLANVKEIYLGRCDGVTNAERQRLKTIGVEVIG